ncbi:hypothetical protein QO002_005666 [Pararhizobium capsulatum DSM 1112]|uniref:Uncharacterized protein n=1 Tax=Pararhizobium capsulatum DSM 1112 TaxID=1121113 RepID=A0ABU0BYW8_9HYPH|nr:hypothetical protein [Pararhizobium capsulatum DSM 1112]
MTVCLDNWHDRLSDSSVDGARFRMVPRGAY